MKYKFNTKDVISYKVCNFMGKKKDLVGEVIELDEKDILIVVNTIEPEVYITIFEVEEMESRNGVQMYKGIVDEYFNGKWRVDPSHKEEFEDLLNEIETEFDITIEK